MGFELNPYDKCAINKIIDAKQYTIVFYIDNKKISHADSNIVTSIINELSKHFGETTVSRGSKYHYLGMDIEIKDCKVYIGMEGQISELLEGGGSQMGRIRATQALSSLFDSTKALEELTTSEAES